MFTANESSYAERDTFRGESIAWINENALAVYSRQLGW